MTQFAILNSIGVTLEQQEAVDAGFALAQYAVRRGMSSSHLSIIGYRAEEIIMASKQMTIEGIEFQIWDKSFRVTHDTITGPIHWLDDNLEDSISKVADVVKAARRRQYELDTEALARLSNPDLE